MYGIIHKALQQMLIEDFGPDIWNQIAEKAGASDTDLISLRSYDDNVALRLVAATSEVLNTPADDCLELFGRYWLERFAPENFSAILNATGGDFVQFITNLNRLHDRITSTFPAYRPPEFFIDDMGDDIYAIEYISTREGFAPFVRGLLQGIAERFDVDAKVLSLTKQSAPTGEHWSFEVKVSKPAATGEPAAS